MGRIGKGILLLLLTIFSIRPASAQPGFISIDCGSSEAYTDPATNIRWVPDAQYISTGLNAAGLNVSSSSRVVESSTAQLTSLRYFNDSSRSRHCYVLPVLPNATYLVRASFVYADYDGKGAAPAFDLAVDATRWTTIDLGATASGNGSGSGNGHADPDPDQIRASWHKPKVAEILLPSAGTSLSVCLIRTARSRDPFVSALELRPIDHGAYSLVRERGVILQTVHRVDCGQHSATSVVRYPDDPFDRFWFAQEDPTSELEGVSIITGDGFPPLSIVEDQPPPLVLQSAWSRAAGFALEWDLPPDFTTFFAALYFAEIDRQVRAGDARIINIGFNGLPWGDPLYLSFPELVLAERSGEVPANGTANFSFVRAAGSMLDPIVNALEFYAILGPPKVATLAQDVAILHALQRQFKLQSWTGDPCLPIPWDWLRCSLTIPPRVMAINLSGTAISGAVPPSITLLEALTDLWLDNNNLTAIPADFTPLANLQTIHLENNRITGNVPTSFKNLHNLRELNLFNNLWNGTLPVELKNTSSLVIRVYGSPYLCIPGKANCKESGSGKTKAIICATVGAATGLLVAGVIVYYYFFRKFPELNLGNRLSDSSFEGLSYEMYSSSGNSPSLPGQDRQSSSSTDYFHQARNLSVDDVKLATNNYKIKIGDGRYGPVFYGQLSPDGQEVAIKQCSLSDEGRETFSKDVAILARVRHKNLVTLIGFCDELDKQMLIFDFMPKGTLRDHLYGISSRMEPLTWPLRLDIALNAARGLEYLHRHCPPWMMHGDVKSSSILLNGNLGAQVSDFGMEKFRREENVRPETGTWHANIGYLDPEYYSGQMSTPKSDVFSFGVVLLEMICARDPTKCPHQMHIIPWVKKLLQNGNIHAIVDPSLKGKYNVEAVWHVAELALLSTELHSMNRPSMGQVLRGLAEAIEIESGSPVSLSTVSEGLGLVSVGYNSGSSRRT